LLTDFHRGSFRIIGEAYRRTLKAIGVDVIELPTPQDPAERREIAANAPGSIILHNTLGDGFEPIPGALNIALPVHEWSRYPAAWVRRLNRFDVVWTTTHHVRDLLLLSGLKVDCAVVPPALDFDVPPLKKTYRAHQPFRFFFIGEPHFRKGHHLLMAGFERAFPQEGEACLTIKTSAGCQWISPRADIRIISEEWTREALLASYHEHDCFVSASLGEGLGLPIAEAAFAGLPVATNLWGGHRSLLCPAGVFVIAHEIADQPYASRPEFFAPGQRCAYSTPAEIAKSLRAIVTSTAEARATQAARARHFIRANYGLEATARLLRASLGTLVFGAGTALPHPRTRGLAVAG
jgi:glycosyltransferase involved in cell wall biosynthesis